MLQTFIHKPLLLLALLLISLHSVAQKTFEGRLKYKIEYLETRADLKGVDRSLPKECELITNGTDWRLTQSTPLDGEMVMIYRSDVDSLYSMMQLGADKITVGQTAPKQQRNLRIVETEETKQIADYQITRWLVREFDGEAESVWVFERFSNTPRAFLPESKCLPAAFDLEKGGMRIAYQVVKVLEEPVDETYFTLTSDFKPIPVSLYQQLLR